MPPQHLGVNKTKGRPSSAQHVKLLLSYDHDEATQSTPMPPRLQSFPLFFTLFSEHHFQALANLGIDVSFLTKRRAMVICMLQHMLLLLTSGNTMRFPNSKHLHAQLNFPRGIGVGPNEWKSAMWHKLGKLVI